MDKQAFYDAGVTCAYRWDSELENNALMAAQCFVDTYLWSVEKLSTREELDAIYAFANGFIDGQEGIASLPDTPALYYATDTRGSIIGIGVQHVCSKDDNDIARRLLDF